MIDMHRKGSTLNITRIHLHHAKQRFVGIVAVLCCAARVRHVTAMPSHLSSIADGPLTESQQSLISSPAPSSTRHVSRRSLLTTDALPTNSPTSCPQFAMEDSYGDGWSGQMYIVCDASTGVTVASGALESPLSEGTDELCLGSGCYYLEVTSGSWDSEVSWTFGAMSGGAPYSVRFFTIVGGTVEGPYQSCPTPAPTTPAPTLTFQPTIAPTLSLVPSVSSLPTASRNPSSLPTISPTSCSQFVMEDSWGDGWSGQNYIVSDADTNVTVASGALEFSLSEGTDELCLGSGCYYLEVTSGSWDSEVSWTFGAMSGGAPCSVRFFMIVGGTVEGPYQSCPTPTPAPTLAPTQSAQPTIAPTLSLVPSVSSAPSNVPTPEPTPSPTSHRFEARTWEELNDALRVNGAVVNATLDIAFTEEIILNSGQDVTVYCNTTAGEEDVSYCATLDGMGSGRLFAVSGGACLRLIRLRITGGFTATATDHGGGLWLFDYGQAHLTGCTVSGNEAGGSGGGLYANNGRVHLTGCTMSNNEAYSSGGLAVEATGQAHLTNCIVSNNQAVYGYGGGIGVKYGGSQAFLTGCTVSHNYAGIDGGGINAYSYAQIHLVNCNVTHNQAVRSDIIMLGCLRTASDFRIAHHARFSTANVHLRRPARYVFVCGSFSLRLCQAHYSPFNLACQPFDDGCWG